MATPGDQAPHGYMYLAVDMSSGVTKRRRGMSSLLLRSGSRLALTAARSAADWLLERYAARTPLDRKPPTWSCIRAGMGGGETGLKKWTCRVTG